MKTPFSISRPIGASALLAGLLLLTLASPALAMKPLREYAATPSDYGILYRDVTFTTGDSLRLHGWFYPAQDTAGIANDLVGGFLAE